MPTEKIIQNLKKCSRFDFCSANRCVLDPGIEEKTYIEGEDVCPFMRNRKKKKGKGYKRMMSSGYLKFVPAKNIKWLLKRNQKRWHGLIKKNGRI